jgi:hypothetical protein
VDVRFHKDVVAPVFALSVVDGRGQVAYDISTHLLGMTTPSFAAGEAVEIVFTIETHLVEGSYEITVDVASSDLTHYFDRRERAIGLIVESANRASGVAICAPQSRSRDDPDPRRAATFRHRSLLQPRAVPRRRDRKRLVSDRRRFRSRRRRRRLDR